MRKILVLLVAACALSGPGRAADTAVAPALRAPDVRYDPTAMEVVQVMLRLGEVTAADVVFDLGCGDGRIVIAAARQAGARGVCVDIDPLRIQESRENARKEGVGDRVEFRNEDLFTTNLAGATVVMLFLWPELNLKLRPRLWRELKPGTRIVSHWHDMGDWKAQNTVSVTDNGRPRNIYLWTVPEKQ